MTTEKPLGRLSPRDWLHLTAAVALASAIFFGSWYMWNRIVIHQMNGYVCTCPRMAK